MKKAVEKKKPAIVITEQGKPAAKVEKAKAGALQITLTNALTGCNKTQIAVAHSLGLKRSGDVVTQPDNAATKGKIAKIAFLLAVTKA